jgi:DNA-binding transcriptional MocR family regulator
MLMKLERNQATPLYQQIIDGIKHLIDRGALEIGQSLPSSRKLAETLGVNRTTVNHAYEELQAQGFLSSSPGSYHRVQKRRKEVEYNPDRKGLISWNKASTDPARQIHEMFLRFSPEHPRSVSALKDTINISRLDLDPRLFPMTEFKRCTNTVLSQSGSASLLYGEYKGFLPLRKLIAQRLRLHGIASGSDEILITNGAQQAIDLLCRIFVRQNAKVAIEAPTYANILPLLQFAGADIAEVPMTDEGMDLHRLDAMLSKEAVSFVYSIPNFHNPTGITTTHEHREQLLSICLKHRVPIVEDGFEEDMKYFGKVPLPIKSIDDANIVIYLGTFSKVLFPGLRIGWVTADRDCISRMTAVKRFSDLTSSPFVQMIMNEFIRGGYYDRQLKRLHRVFRKRMQLALAKMDEHFPKETPWTKPAGGYTIWVKLPLKMDEAHLHAHMLEHGVVVSPGSYYFPRQTKSDHFRISISRLNESEISEGLARAGRALHRMIAGD